MSILVVEDEKEIADGIQAIIHFYVNRCGFHIVEFFNEHHADPREPLHYDTADNDEFDGMFRFQKVIK